MPLLLVLSIAAFVSAFTILYAWREPFEWSWFARVPGMALGGLLLFLVKPPAADWVVPVIGWGVPFAWWWVVRNTRVGDWPWKEHLLASSLWFGSNATACGLWFLNGLAP